MVRAVDGVTFTLDRGKTLGVVGESGSGKTVLSRSIMGLLPSNAEVTGTVLYEGSDITGAARRRDARHLGHRDGDGVPGPDDLAQPGDEDRQARSPSRCATTSTWPRPSASRVALALLKSVGIPEPERRLNEYPHQLSGGMRQRVTIAIALACGPKLLFADEPTTALDVTVQAQILDLLQEQQRERFMAMILVTHDLGVVAGRADDIAVMYAGQVVEKAPTRTLFAEMRMPYTEALLKSIPKLDAAEPHPPRGDRRSPAGPDQPAEGLPVLAPLPVRAGQVRRGGPARRRGRHARPPLQVLVPGRHARERGGPRARTSPAARRRPARRCRPREGVLTAAADRGGPRLMAGSGTAHLRPDLRPAAAGREPRTSSSAAGRGRSVKAVTNVSLDVLEGETLGLVGESGCGKSTTGRAIMQLPRPTSGHVWFEGEDLTTLKGETLRKVRPQMQLIFQDPISSLNPRRTRRRHRRRAAAHLGPGRRGGASAPWSRRCSPTSASTPRSPSRSGPTSSPAGSASASRSPARSCSSPKVIICDEPVSALDVSVQAQILNLLEDMKARYGLTLIFIAHDLAVVKNVSDRVAVMYLGKLCEVGVARRPLRTARAPRTRPRCCRRSRCPDPSAPAGRPDEARRRASRRR